MITLYLAYIVRANQHNPGKVEKHLARNIHIARREYGSTLFFEVSESH